MNWNEIGTQLIIGVIGVVMAALGTIITYLINKFVKDERLKRITTSLNDLVQKAVLTTQQTFVDDLKKSGDWTLEAQKKALAKSLTLVKTNMPNDVYEWLKSNHMDIDDYLRSMIEANVKLLKEGGK